MNQRDLVLSCMAAAGGDAYRPVQIQKLIFLFEKKALKTQVFNFIPFDYGPFDHTVYTHLEDLSNEGMVEIMGGPFSKERRYKLTEKGKKQAQIAFNNLPKSQREYLVLLSQWVRNLTFAQLVGAIYNEYPEMKENSVFKE